MPMDADADLQAKIVELTEKHGVPSLAVAVMENGAIRQAAHGVRKIGDEAAVSLDDRFHFGSCTKAVTAQLIHMLANDGLLTLRDPITTYYPMAHEAYAAVTIADLLTHTSGLAAADGYLHDPPAHTYGTFHYSNLGYILLGDIAQQVTGKPYKALVEERIAHPLGMTSAGFGVADDSPAGSAPQQPWGHRRDDNALIPINQDNPDIYAAAGGMHASVSDWMKFMKHMLGQHTIKSPVKTVDANNGQYYTSAAFRKGKQGILVHDGNNVFNLSRHMLLPERNAAIVITTNDGSEQARHAMDELTQHIITHELTPTRSPSADSTPPLPK